MLCLKTSTTPSDPHRCCHPLKSVGAFLFICIKGFQICNLAFDSSSTSPILGDCWISNVQK
jgi:hypothetical protein